MGLKYCLILAAVVGSSLAYSGQYIPKSYYLIDENGHKSDVVFIRSRRDLEIPLLRVRRGGGGGGGQSYASSSAQSSASSGGGYGSGGGGGGAGGAPINFNDFVPNINPSDFIPDIGAHLNQLAANLPSGSGGGGGHAGASSFASASSSSNAGAGSGYGNSGNAGGLGAGHQAGYNGPVLFSRFGESEGSGIQASGSAQGPHGAFSSTSTSSKDGKVKYSVQSGKY